MDHSMQIAPAEDLYILEEDEESSALTQSEMLFQSLISQGKSPEDASIEAYPAKKFPIKYALSKIANKNFTRANYHVNLAKVGFTEEKTASLLMEAADLAEDDPKASTALLNVVKEAHKIYDLYPQEQRQESLTIGSINITDRSQLLQQVYNQAKEEMPEEQIDKMVESAKIGELGVIPKKELFEDGT